MIQGRAIAVILLIPLLYFALWTPAPMKYGPMNPEPDHPSSPADLRASAAIVDEYAGADGQVWTVHAEYFILSKASAPYSPRIYHLTSPQHGYLDGFKYTDHHDAMREEFTQDLRNGTLTVLIVTNRVNYMLSEWPEARQAFRTNYCRVTPRPDVYADTGANAYYYAPERVQKCINETRFNNTYDW